MMSKSPQGQAQNFYLIVEFPKEVSDDGTIPTAIVSSTWVFDDQGKSFCWWPNCRSDAHRKKAVISHSNIDVDNSMQCEVNIKYKTDVYQKAAQKIKQLEFNTDCSSENDNKKRRKKSSGKYSNEYAYKLSDLSGYSSDSVSPPPTPPKKKKMTEKGGKEAVNSSIEPWKEINQWQQTNRINHVEESQPANIVTISNENTGKQTIESMPVIIEAAKQDCTSCKIVEGIASNILRIVQSNSRKIDDLNQIVNAVIQTRGDYVRYQDPASYNNELNELPLGTIEDLNNFEQRLSDRDEYVKMVEAFKLIGGKDTFDTIRRIMSKILNNALALNINWVGRNEKPAFKNFHNVLSLITDTVRKNPLALQATDNEIQTVIKQWLRGAIDRGGGRQKRQKECDRQNA